MAEGGQNSPLVEVRLLSALFPVPRTQFVPGQAASNASLTINFADVGLKGTVQVSGAQRTKKLYCSHVKKCMRYVRL